MIFRLRMPVVLAALICSANAWALDIESQLDFNIAPQRLATALVQFSRQANAPIVSDTKEVSAFDSPGVSGRMSVRSALQALLSGTRLSYKVTESGAIAVGPFTQTASSALPDAGNAPSKLRLAQADSRDDTPRSATASASAAKKEELEEIVVSIPEVLVVGSKILNMDIRRTRDDPQPYVIFEREVIEQSGARSLEDFLKQRLTMNTRNTTGVQSATSIVGNQSKINLRGLGDNQTLILVDGHRAVSTVAQGQPLQSDLNGIPLAAVERIEVLPTTASGIYGGSATGGVVNVVLRRDYTGAEAKATYENSFDTDTGISRADLSAGFNLEDGRTNILFAASYSDSNVLTVADRDFIQRGRERILANNPGFFLNASSPLLGATTNIRSLTGANLTLDPAFGGTALDSPITFVPVGYAGAASDGGAALVANAGSYNFDLADSAQSQAKRQSLFSASTVESVNVTVRREFSDRVQAFLEATASDSRTETAASFTATPAFIIPASAPNNPFAQDIWVTVPTAGGDGEHETLTRARRLVGGVIVKLTRNWSAEADFTWDRSRLNLSSPGGLTPAGTAALANGTLDVLRDTTAFPLALEPYRLPDSGHLSPYGAVLKDSALRFSGPLGSLPAGAPVASVLLEHRDEQFPESRLQSDATVFRFPEQSQSVDSAYLELRIPLVSAKNAIPGVREFELQLAGRRDQYTVNGTTGLITEGSSEQVVRATNKNNSTNPTLGLRYRPFDDLTLRASYGTGFLPPAVHQLVPNAPFTCPGCFLDPRRGNEPVGAAELRFGGNPDLVPEESKSWSAGLILTPRVIQGLRLSADYTHIDKTDNIVDLVTGLVDLDPIEPLGRITRGPVPPNDPYGVGPVTIIDATMLNLARARLDAVDIAIDYHAATERFGTFDFFAAATRTLHYETQTLPTDPVVENVGVAGSIGNEFPLELKGNAGAIWELGRWSLGWTTTYHDSYRVSRNATVVMNQGSETVASQLYHDVFARYRFVGDRARGIGAALRDTEVQLTVKNVFDEDPPFDAGDTSSYYSALGDPRGAVYSLTVRKAF